MKRASDVFGLSNSILLDSYVDRGALDERLQTLLQRPGHIALRGESKCGKSWLRQKNLPGAIIVQCRHNKSISDIYVDILSQLDINLTLNRTEARKLNGRATAKGEFGLKLLAKVGLQGELDLARETATRSQPAGHNVDDLRFVAEVVRDFLEKA